MDSAPSTRDLICRLERPDGSVWRVTALDLESGPATVSAVLNDPVHPGTEKNGRLRDEPLRRGDRLEWRDATGEVVWAMKAPLDASESG